MGARVMARELTADDRSRLAEGRRSPLAFEARRRLIHGRSGVIDAEEEPVWRMAYRSWVPTMGHLRWAIRTPTKGRRHGYRLQLPSRD